MSTETCISGGCLCNAKKGKIRLKKGSEAAKSYMASIRNKKRSSNPKSRVLGYEKARKDVRH